MQRSEALRIISEYKKEIEGFGVRGLNLGIIGEAARHVPSHLQERILESPGVRCAACATWSYTSTPVSAPG